MVQTTADADRICSLSVFPSFCRVSSRLGFSLSPKRSYSTSFFSALSLRTLTLTGLGSNLVLGDRRGSWRRRKQDGGTGGTVVPAAGSQTRPRETTDSMLTGENEGEGGGEARRGKVSTVRKADSSVEADYLRANLRQPVCVRMTREAGGRIVYVQRGEGGKRRRGFRRKEGEDARRRGGVRMGWGEGLLTVVVSGGSGSGSGVSGSGSGNGWWWWLSGSG